MIEAYKATGPGWQTRMNEALVEAARKLKAA
ncbi:BrnA antitoxin family protein [Methylobacterium sp. Leaf399]|nr:BrnA antitoxin family protein [Methylobacterium sp. Leaf399]